MVTDMAACEPDEKPSDWTDNLDEQRDEVNYLFGCIIIEPGYLW